jgi:hypothetical protein
MWGCYSWPMTSDKLRFSHGPYLLWWTLTTMSFCAAILTGPIGGAWDWSLGWTVGGLALSAHARLERLDGHHHRDGTVEVPK